MKKYLLVLLFTLLFTLSACNNTTPTTTIDPLETVVSELTLDTELEAIQLPTTIDDVTITWDSSDKTTLSNDYRIVQKETDTNVTLTAYLVLDGRLLTKEFEVTILKMINENPDDNTSNPDDNTTTDPDVDYTGYYDGAEGLVGTQLKTFLHELIDDHTVVSYGDLRDALQDSDEDPDNPDNIILLYTGDSIPSTWDGGASWNREHVWPKSLGDMSKSDDEYSDMHHLRPTNPGVNSDRGNLEFDNGGSLVKNTDDCYADSNSFEPRDEVKGDVARMIFYMAVRYEGDSGEADLEIVDYINGSAPTIGMLDTLLEWHEADPVDDFEMNRNDVIFSYQGNRNPFIDHPEFVDLVFGDNN